MTAREFLETNANDGLVKEIAADYSGEKKAYAQTKDILEKEIAEAIKNGADTSNLKAKYDLYGAANSVCYAAGLFENYLDREIDTEGYFDGFVSKL